MPLYLAPLNSEVHIARMAVPPKEAAHLASLGLVEDGPITVLSSQGGSVVVLVRGSRLALDRQTASKIFVA